MDQNGFASKAFLRAGRAAAGQRNAATGLSAVEASNMFRVMAAVAAVTLLVVLCARSYPFDRKPARGSREGSGGARARTQEPLTGLQPAARDGPNGFPASAAGAASRSFPFRPPPWRARNPPLCRGLVRFEIKKQGNLFECAVQRSESTF